MIGARVAPGRGACLRCWPCRVPAAVRRLPADARFCPACGADLSGRGPHDERKFVSVLFVDMVGSTDRADGADPEDVRDLNQRYHQELRERIERFGGVVEKFIGDAVMAVFGAPLAHDDDAERAVRAALDALEAIEELNRSRPELGLQVRAAVCTGEAVVTLDAAPGEPLATGDVVNIAARLQSAAPPGRVDRRRGDPSAHGARLHLRRDRPRPSEGQARAHARLVGR